MDTISVENTVPGDVCTVGGDLRGVDVRGEVNIVSRGKMFVTAEQAAVANAFGWMLGSETLAD